MCRLLLKHIPLISYTLSKYNVFIYENASYLIRGYPLNIEYFMRKQKDSISALIFHAKLFFGINLKGKILIIKTLLINCVKKP